MPYTVDRNLGWNAGARSQRICFGDCQLRFSSPSSNTGLCIGFNTEDRDASFREIKFALFLQATTAGPRAFIYESGVQKYAAGAYESDDIFTIRRTDGVVRYFKNDTLLYTSLTASFGAIFADSSLYAGGDSI
jgi:hypothetical protein